MPTYLFTTITKPGVPPTHIRVKAASLEGAKMKSGLFGRRMTAEELKGWKKEAK